MSNIILPNIEHATVTLNERNRVVIQMDEGWLFYRLDMYPEDTPPEEICYSRYCVVSPATDFSLFVVVAEADVPANQIFSDPAPTPPAETI